MAEHENLDIFKCGLCSESLNIPKSLLCLHMFCESCICQHIQRVVDSEQGKERCKQFLCPECKTAIPLPDKVNPSTYARNLSTNNLIEALARRLRVQHEEIDCGLCPQEEKAQPAKVWCDDCNEGLCDQCCKFHKRVKSLQTHSIINMHEIGSSSRKVHIDTFCREHQGKKIETFCHDHQITCCSSCMTDYHRKCDHVTTLEKASQDINQSSTDLMQTIDDVIDMAEYYLGIKGDTLNQIEKDKKGIIEKIRSFRSQINTHLDKLESDFEREFETSHEIVKAEIQNETEKCSNHKKIAMNCKQLLTVTIDHSSDENIFCEKQLIEQKIKEEEVTLTEITADPTKIRYEIDLTPELVNFTESVTSLGAFRSIKLSPAQQMVLPFQNQPKNDLPATKYYTLQEISTFTTDKFPSGRIHGAKSLQDGRILLTNFVNKSLLVFENTGHLKQEIKLPGGPVDVILISDTEAAVSYWSPNGIAVVDINTMTVREQNIMKDPDVIVCGITSDGVKLVGACRDMILIMDMTGTTLRVIKTKYTEDYRYISYVSETRLCYSNPHRHLLQCIDLDGTEIFTYQHENLNRPYGITSDDGGVIYVAGLNSHNVHQISHEGKLIKIILSKENGIEYPLAIHYNLTTKKLLLTHSEKALTVYQTQ